MAKKLRKRSLSILNDSTEATKGASLTSHPISKRQRSLNPSGYSEQSLLHYSYPSGPHRLLQVKPKHSQYLWILDRQLSVSSSIESFHSFHSAISPLAPSPTSSNSSLEQWAAGLDYAKTRGHTRETSEITITGRQPERWDMADDINKKRGLLEKPAASTTTATTPTIEQPKTPTLSRSEDDWSDAPAPVEAPTPNKVRLRRARRRPRSPLPLSTNLYSPYSLRSHMSGHHLTTAIL